MVAGEDGLRSFDRPGQIVIEISRLPIAEKERARRCARRDRQDHSRLPGERHPDRGWRAASSRSPAASLACARIEPVLLGFCKKSTYFGPFGCGMKVKLVGNLLRLVHNCAAAEAMVLGTKSGIEPKLIHQAISASGSARAYSRRAAP